MSERLEWELLTKETAFIAGMDRAVKKAAQFDAMLAKVTGGQVSFNRATRQYVDTSGEVVKRIHLQELMVSQLAQATDRATRATTRVAGAQRQAAAATQQVSVSAGRGSGALTQLSYAVNDLQAGIQGGLRGALIGISNNLQMMAVAGGLSGGAVFVISALTTAAAAAAPALEDMFLASRKEAEKATEAYKDALDAVLEFDKVRGIKISDEQLPAAIRLQEANLKAAREGMRLMGNEVDRLRTAPVLSDLQARGADPKVVLAGANALLNLTQKTVTENELLLERLKERQRQVTAETQLQQQLLELGGEYADKEKRAKEEAREFNKALLERMRIRALEGRVVEKMAKDLNKYLRPPITATGAAGLERAGRPLSATEAMARSGLTRIGALGREEMIPGQPRSMSDAVVTEMQALGLAIDEQGQLVVTKALAVRAEIKSVMADFGPAIAGGLASAAVDLLSGAATFNQALGGFLSGLGQSLIQTGVAGVALKVFVKRPELAIAAGIGLELMGRALSASSQKRVDDFTATTTGVGAAGPARAPIFGVGPSGGSASSPALRPGPAGGVGVEIGQAVRRSLEGATVRVDGRSLKLVLANVDRADGRLGRAA